MVENNTIMGSPQTVKKVKNGSTYYYERTPGYDPKTKNTAYKYRYVGKEMYGKVGRIRITLPRRSYIYGPFLPLVKIMDSLRMGEILSTITGMKISG